MAWLKPITVERKVVFVSAPPECREYLVTLFGTGMADFEEPPKVVSETYDGWIEASDGRRWPSLSHMAIEHGCIVGDFGSDDPLRETDN